MNPGWTIIQQAISFFLQGVLLLLVVSVSLRHLFRTNHFGGAVLRMWGGFVAWSVFVCLVMPLGITLITDDSSAFYIFPESTGIMAILLTGWIHSIVICFVARACHFFWLRVFSPNAQNRSP